MGLRLLFDSLACVRDIDHTGADVLTDRAEHWERTSFRIGESKECRLTRILSGHADGGGSGEVAAKMADVNHRTVALVS